GGAAARSAPGLHRAPAVVRVAEATRASSADRAGRRGRDHGGHGLMGVWADLYNGETRFNFPKWWPRALVLSAVLILVSIGSFARRGLNLGIDFEGGTSWEVLSPDASVADARDVLRPFGAAEAKIQIVDGEVLRTQSTFDAPEGVREIT